MSSVLKKRIKNKNEPAGDGSVSVGDPETTKHIDLELVPNSMTGKETKTSNDIDIEDLEDKPKSKKESRAEQAQNLKAFIYFLMSDEIQGMVKANEINHFHAAKLFKERTGINITTKTARLHFRSWIRVKDEDNNTYYVKKNHLNKI